MWWLITLLTLFLIFQVFLEVINNRNFQNSIPKELENIYTDDELIKARNYSSDQLKIGIFSQVLSYIIFVSMIVLGGFNIVVDWGRSYFESEIIVGLFSIGLLYFGNWIIGIPLSWFSAFRIEKKYEENKYTTRLFISDQIKQFFLALIIGGILLYLFGIIHQWLKEDFWWVFWIVMLVVTLFFTAFYTKLLLPLFNKLNPLESGDLKSEIESFCLKVGYKINRLFVMDGSKRSAKANAFFSGLGNQKTIVLYDTLIQNHTKEEITAVLAHEIGHYKKKHTLINVFVSATTSFITLWLLGLVINSAILTQALGVENHNIYIALVGFGVIYTPISILLGWLQNYGSRVMEYQADEFAAKKYGSIHLISALKKLSVKNLSNINPHPIYVAVFHSHPKLNDRISFLNRFNND